jgi:aspartate/glutamate racemase
MKKIGILGGMSPESTTLYYEHITRTYTAQHGDLPLFNTALLQAAKALAIAVQPEK